MWKVWMINESVSGSLPQAQECRSEDQARRKACGFIRYPFTSRSSTSKSRTVAALGSTTSSAGATGTLRRLGRIFCR
jgi:hypothetical protein